MAVGSESLGVGEVIKLLGDGLLERRGWGDVGDLPAVRAKEMMVVFGQVLGELETRELVIGRNAPNDAGAPEVDEMAVRGASRHRRQQLGDIADAHRVARTQEQVDDRAPSACVSLVDPA